MMPDRSHGHRRTRLTVPDSNATPVSIRALRWRRQFEYLKPYRGRMALATLALLISTGLGLAFPMVTWSFLGSMRPSSASAAPG